MLIFLVPHCGNKKLVAYWNVAAFLPTTPALFELHSPKKVTISWDHAVLLLVSTAGVRYRTTPLGDFKGYSSTVSYIDADANEKDYFLEEQYYLTMIGTAALGFQQ
jgi:hypothetical protein